MRNEEVMIIVSCNMLLFQAINKGNLIIKRLMVIAPKPNNRGWYFSQHFLTRSRLTRYVPMNKGVLC